MDQQPPKPILDRLPQLPPRPSSKSNVPAAGKEEAARKRLTARLETMSGQVLEPPAVDPRTAAVAALMVANFVGEEAARKRFMPLVGAKLFDANALEDLPVAARFVLRILPKLGADLDQRDMFPKTSLLTAVKATKDEMVRLADRYLGDIDEAHGRIVTVRLGDGPADDVHDLRMLADLWRDYAETLSSDAGTLYRKEAEREARELATNLELALLGPLSEEDHEWRSYLHRALAMLVPLYDEVCRAGRFLFHDEKPEARFPTLASVARVRRRLKRETSRRNESIPPSTGPKRAMSSASKMRAVSMAPEVSLVDVSSEDEAALASAMISVPPNAPSSGWSLPVMGVPSIPLVSEGPKVQAPTTGPKGVEVRAATVSPMRLPSKTTTLKPGMATLSSVQHSAVPPVGSLVAPPVPLLSEPIVERDPFEAVHLVEAVSLDFSPTASAGEDADTNLDTADLDLEVTYASESNFYADLAGDAVGLFIATYVVKPSGTPLVVRLSLPQLEDPIVVGGTIRWVREFSPSLEAPPGMGLALEGLTARQKGAIEAFMKFRSPLLHDEE